MSFVSAKVPKEPFLLWQLLQNQGRPVFWHPGGLRNARNQMDSLGHDNWQTVCQTHGIALCNESCNSHQLKLLPNKKYNTELWKGSMVPKIQCIVLNHRTLLQWRRATARRVGRIQDREWVDKSHLQKINAMLFGAPIPIGSMYYGIFTYIWLICMVNVGKYIIHGFLWV